MNPVIKSTTKKNRVYDVKHIYSQCQITKSIMLPFSAVGKNIHQTIEQTIAAMIEGKCIVEGFVKYASVKILTFSSGIIKADNVLFDVVFNCDVCFPVAGMGLNCVAKNITKAGIRAESLEEENSPFVLFIARDHHFSNDYFNSIEENDKILARVIAQRFELNDKYVSIVAELVVPHRDQNRDQNKDQKPKLIL